MNRKLIIWIVVAIVVVIAGFFIFGGYDSGSDSSQNGFPGDSGTSASQEYRDLDSDQEVFNTLDEAIGFLE